jgi:hypothetical protein
MDTTSLPPLEWDKSGWIGTIALPEWSGFLTCDGSYNRIGSTQPSTGELQLYVNVPSQAMILPEQLAAFTYLKENGESIREAILKAIFEKYPEWQEEFGFDEDEKAKYMPDLLEAGQLKTLMGPATIFLHTFVKDGMAYIGFECGCTWDDEHGLGVLIHGERVVGLGEADTAILGWEAKKDGGIDLAPALLQPDTKLPIQEEEPEPTQLSLFG